MGGRRGHERSGGTLWKSGEEFEVALINLDRTSLTASLAKSRFVSLGGTFTIPYRSTRGKVTMVYH